MAECKATLRAIFDQALEMEDAAQRQAYLVQACGDNSSLRMEVDELLAAHEAVGGFLGNTNRRDTMETAKCSENEGDRIGRYRLLQKIGEGGCGVVYMAEQTEPVRRRVALKIIKLGMDTRSVIARFEAERQALALMDHPNIAHVLDAGATETGRPFFVMELVRGLKITDYCDQYHLPTIERLQLFIQVCQAVQHAHHKGIIHRDLKPSNILVTSNDGVPLPKVIDFGIAKATGNQNLTDKTLFTRFEMFIGTPAYMSPEQAEFNASDVDTRTDVYALGVLLYELLTGATPFDSGTLLKSGIDEMRRTIRETEPTRPSTKLNTLGAAALAEVARRRQLDPPKLIALVRGDLDWIVLKALEKDRTRRYATPSALAHDVGCHLRHEPIAARPPSARYTFSRWVLRHRLVFAVATTGIALLVLGVVASTWQAVRATRAERLQRELRLQADSARYQADSARNEAVIRAYAADVKAASIALQEGNLGQAISLLDRHVIKTNAPDFHGFEWALLRSRAHGDEVASYPHTGIVGGVAFALDGTWVAGGANYGDVRVWDAASGRLLKTLPGQKTREVRHSVSLSPDGRTLAICRDHAIDIYATEDWRLQKEIPAWPNGITFTPDGRLAWTGTNGIHFHTAPSWTENQNELLPIATHHNACKLSFSADGSTLALLINNLRAVQLWDVRARTRIATMNYAVISVALSPDRRRLAMGSSDGNLILWDVTANREIASTNAHGSWLMDLSFSPDSTLLATAGGDQAIRRWDMQAENPLATESGVWRGHWNEVWSVRFSQDGRHLITGGKDAAVKLWRATPPRPRLSEVILPGAVQRGFSADGSRFRTRQGGTIQFWNVQDGSAAATWSLPANAYGRDKIRELEVYSGDKVYFSTTNQTIESYTIPAGELLRSVTCEGGPISPVCIAQDDRTLIGLNRKTRLAGVWDFTTGRHLVDLPEFVHNESSPAVHRISLASDGRRVAYPGRGFTARIWDLERRTLIRELNGHSWYLYSVAFSPDGKRVVTAGWDGTVVIWDPETGHPVMPALRGHFSGAQALSFSADGRTLVTHSDRSVRFWNLATGTELFSMTNADVYWQCPIAPDGRTLAWRRTSDQVFQIERIRGF